MEDPSSESFNISFSFIISFSMLLSKMLEGGLPTAGLATFGTGMTSGAHVIGSYVSLEIGGVSENFVTIFTGKSPEFPMYHFVS